MTNFLALCENAVTLNISWSNSANFHHGTFNYVKVNYNLCKKLSNQLKCRVIGKCINCDPWLSENPENSYV